MMERGHEVVVLCPSESSILAEASRWSVPTQALPIGRKNFGGLLAMRRWLTTHKVDVLNTHSSTDSWLAALACATINNPPPIVRTRHISAPVPDNAPTRWLYTKATRHIVTTGEALRKELSEKNGYPVAMITSVPTGIDPSRFEVVLYQYVRFLKEGVLQRMGRRTGQFLLLEDVLDAVGPDVARFFLLQRGADSPLDFDFELAVQQSSDNPVYYVQYAHARISSIFKTAAERGITPEGADLSLLAAPGERELLRLAMKLPELLTEIVAHRGVHILTVYALELAGAFHGFYRDHRVVDESDTPRSKARLRLVQAIQVTLRQTLRLLGVSAPDAM